MKTKPLDTVQPAHDVAARLATEFDGLLPPELVTRIVMEAICDLYGQVQPKAFPELLHRLAHYRLDIRVQQSLLDSGSSSGSADKTPATRAQEPTRSASSARPEPTYTD